MPEGAGELKAEFAVRGGRTVLVQRYHTSPLKIAKTFRVEPTRYEGGGEAAEPGVLAAAAAEGRAGREGAGAAVTAAGADGGSRGADGRVGRAGAGAVVAAAGADGGSRGAYWRVGRAGAGAVVAAAGADGGSRGADGRVERADAGAVVAAAGADGGSCGADGRVERADAGAVVAAAGADGGSRVAAATSAPGGADEQQRDGGRPVRGEQVAVYVMDCSPGLMDGDRYELSWSLQPGAHVYLTNQSFTKVHPAGAAGGAVQRQTIRLGREAVLEYMPEPVMLYADAAYCGETDVHLEQGSVLMLSDVLCPGRTGRGELFQYKRYANRMRVWHGEQLIYAQHQRVEPAAMRLAASGCWEEQTHLGTLCVFAEAVGPLHVEAALSCLESLGDGRLRYGASLTYRHGLVVSVLGGSAWELQRALAAVWQLLRGQLLGCGPLALGK
ncbi:urease accessory protein UreD [Paenibacillus athensensis]|uniref:Urease accessory protein UreD n=1 Tax=Paenibacillus athensensis TaxID=1967502 RepID=A0A4Y8Q6B8_9BACL|nr:urease accessory protein UreD [Paenibacillus athensensis]MCD1259829.1 urease accessory protein UreD [Paenibacillus athensensis]